MNTNLQVEFLLKELTPEQIRILRKHYKKHSTLIEKSEMKTRRKLIQYLLAKGYTLRALGEISHKSYQSIYNYSKK